MTFCARSIQLLLTSDTAVACTGISGKSSGRRARTRCAQPTQVTVCPARIKPRPIARVGFTWPAKGGTTNMNLAISGFQPFREFLQSAHDEAAQLVGFFPENGMRATLPDVNFAERDPGP